jgi:hypothetical protein
MLWTVSPMPAALLLGFVGSARREFCFEREARLMTPKSPGPHFVGLFGLKVCESGHYCVRAKPCSPKLIPSIWRIGVATQPQSIRQLTAFEQRNGRLFISTDPNRLDIGAIHRFFVLVRLGDRGYGPRDT